MTNANTIEPTAPATLAAAEQLARLRQERLAIEDRIVEILRQFPEGTDLRPEWHCERCDHTWRGQDQLRPPRGCPQCGSTGWRFPSTRGNARRPSDPPNPNWKKNRKTGRPQTPLSEKSFAEHASDARSRVRHKRNGEPLRRRDVGTGLDVAPPPRLANVTLVAPPPQRFLDAPAPVVIRLNDEWPWNDYELESVASDGTILPEGEDECAT